MILCYFLTLTRQLKENEVFTSVKDKGLVPVLPDMLNSHSAMTSRGFTVVKVVLLQCTSNMEVEHHAFLTSFGSQVHAPVVSIHRENAAHIQLV
jgi:hypothetical protein